MDPKDNGLISKIICWKQVIEPNHNSTASFVIHIIERGNCRTHLISVMGS